MINVAELRKALESTLEENGRPLTCKEKIKKIFAVKESIDFSDNLCKRVEVDPLACNDLNNLSPAKLAKDFGVSYADAQNHMLNNPNFWAVKESAGSISASLMQPIDLWASSVLGMFGLKVLEGYTLAPLVYKELCTEEGTSIPAGHKHIRAAYDGTLPRKPLAEGQKAPEVGAKPAWIWSQHTETYQEGASITMEAMFAEAAAGQFHSAAKTVGEAIAWNENDRGLDVVLGRVNTYSYNSEQPVPNNNTYQTSAGTAPFDYVNSGTGAVVTASDLNQAYLTLLANKDPVLNRRISLDKKLDLWVLPDGVFPAAQLIKTMQAFSSPSAVLSGSQNINVTPNPLTLSGYEITLRDLSYLALDRLRLKGSNFDGSSLAAVASDAIAKKFALFGNPKKSFTYEVLQAITPRTLPLTADDMLRRIVFRGDALVLSRYVVKDPRYTYLFAPTS